MSVKEIPELKADILALKKQTGTAVFSHFYQDPDVIEISDGFGDTMDIARMAAQSPCERVVVCGVSFTAETVELLLPEKEIILAHPQARCPMTGQIYPRRIDMYREEHPDTCVVTCISSSAALKAVSDVCVTATNAVEVLRALSETDILFAGDGNLGEYIAENLPEKNIEVWSCCCPVLSFIDERDIELSRQKWPGARVAANNSCTAEVRKAADYIGSTADIIRYCEAVEWDVIVADEVSVCKLLRRRCEGRGFYQPAPSKLICNNMEITSLETVERVLKGEFGLRVSVEENLRVNAKKPIDRMLGLILSENQM